MSEQHRIEALIEQLRAHVSEVRRLRARGVAATELRPREREILRLQRHLALGVRDMFSEQHEPPVHSHRLGSDQR